MGCKWLLRWIRIWVWLGDILRCLEGMGMVGEVRCQMRGSGFLMIVGI